MTWRGQKKAKDKFTEEREAASGTVEGAQGP